MQRKSFVTLLVLFLSAMIVAACAVPPAPQTVPSGEVAQPTSTEQEGGVITFQWQFWESVQPPTNNRVPRMIFGRLIDADADGSLHANLAETWEASSDGTQFTFNLRKGVKWHDLQDFTAKDVAFTITYLCSKAALLFAGDSCAPNHLGAIQGAVAYTEGQATDIEGIEIVDDYTIRLTLAEPNVGWLLTSIARRNIIPEHVYAKINPEDLKEAKSPVYFQKDIQVGTGPFKWVDGEDEKFVRLERFDQFWGGKPILDGLLFQNFGDADTAYLANQKGELDVHTGNGDNSGVSGVFYQLAQEVSHLDVVIFRRPYHRQLAINLHKPYLQDVRVRQAISHAINRQELIDGPLMGLAEPRWTFVENDKWTNPNVVTYPYDPAKAKELLAAAAADGTWDPNQEIELIYYYPGAQAREFMSAMQQYFTAVGINARLLYATGTALEEKIANLEHDLIYQGVGYPADPAAYEFLYRCDDQTGGVFQGAMPELCHQMADLFKAGRSVANEAERRKIYDELQLLDSQNLPQITLYQLTAAVAINRRVGGFDQSAQAWILSWEYNNFHAQDWFIRAN